MPPVLNGRRIVLRAPMPSDQQDRLEWGRDPEFRRMVGGNPDTLLPLSAEEVRGWYDTVRVDPLCWVIEADGKCIGTARLRIADEANRRARYSIGIFHPSYWGQGYGTEATRLVLRYAFEELTLHRVELR